MDIAELRLDRGCHPSRRVWSGFCAELRESVTLRELGWGGDPYGLGVTSPWALCVGPRVLAAMFEREAYFGQINYLSGLTDDREAKFVVTMRANGQVILSREPLVDDFDYQMTGRPAYGWDGQVLMEVGGARF